MKKDPRAHHQLQQLSAEFELMTKLRTEVLGDKFEKVIESDRIIDSPCVLTTDYRTWITS